MSLDVSIGKDVATTPRNIWICLYHTNRVDEAIDYLKRSLQNMENASLDMNRDKDVERAQFCMGMCLSKNQLAQAIDFFNRSMQILNCASSGDAIDENAAYPFHKMGIGWSITN